jgi:hypothetical protein
MLNSGADICQVQPCVRDRKIKKTQHIVEGVTGDLLDARESRNLDF